MSTEICNSIAFGVSKLRRLSFWQQQHADDECGAIVE
jgi:hypothetical protein